MKKNLCIAAILTGLVGFSLVSAHAATVTKTNTVVFTDTYGDLTLGKFDERLGTLTGISVTINFSTLQGSFDITNRATIIANVNGVTNSLTIKQKSTNNLGFTQVGQSFVDSVVTSPDWNNTDIAASGGKVTFNIEAGQNFITNSTSSVDQVFWGNYQSADGSGTVVFQGKETNPITATGGDYGVTSTNTTANTKMSVTYTYAPPILVPEPATWAILLGGVGMLAIGQRMRRRCA